MRRNGIQVFLLSLAMLALGSVTKTVNGQEAPRILVQANAPGWVTVSWEHTGESVYYFAVKRQDSPYTENSVFPVAESRNRTDSVTDRGLKADTLYKFHVCAVYAYSQTCSDWVSVRTLPPPPPSGGTSGGAPPPPAREPLGIPAIRATRDEDPGHVLLDWSGDPGWERYGLSSGGSVSDQNDISGRPLYAHPRVKNVVVYYGADSKNTATLYDARQKEGPMWYGKYPSLLAITANVRANTMYVFKACFTSTDNETKCSREISARGKPAVPTAPADLTISEERVSGNAGALDARIRTVITARWRNQENFIPGLFVALEREDRVQLDSIRLGPAWVEVKQISADPRPLDPTEITADVTVVDPELLTRRGNKYRVCAVVPALGAAGKVCSPALTPTAVNNSPGGRVEPPPAVDLNALAARGEAVANKDPLAVELRERQPEGSARRGFDIGMAAAEGQTAPGPGKDRIRDSLPPDERQGFITAVAFTLERNKYAARATLGAQIAAADETVAEARNAEADPFYRLGFDIATAIFGDPAQGAQGNTAMGPGSAGIRNSLSASGQRGFDAAVKLHLGRNYKR